MLEYRRDEDPVAIARRVIETEIEGLRQISASLNESMAKAVDVLVGIKGYCVVTGVGKSGHIGRKIAATLASTGTPSFFIHPTEMSHGDLGALRHDGALIAISNSGEARELRDALIFCNRNHIPIIGITRNAGSRVGRMATALLTLPAAPEACPNGLAPTTSTTATLALGDALSIAVMVRRGFGREDFGLRHPGGSLGLQLQTVGDWLMDKTPNPPLVKPTDSVMAAINCVSRGRQGCCAVVDESGQMIGMITDGDLRRAMERGLMDKTAADVMTPNPTTFSPEMRMGDVIRTLVDRRIANAFIVEAGKPLAVIDMKDLMQAGFLG